MPSIKGEPITRLIPAICIIVFIFPRVETLTIFPLTEVATHSLKDIIKISLEIMKIVIINNKIESLLATKETSTTKTKNLSAIGSRNAPNFDCVDCLLANAPSRASLSDPRINIITAKTIAMSEFMNNKKDTTIANKNLEIVIDVGKFFIVNRV